MADWDILDVDDWIEAAALTAIVRFYPSAVSNATKIPQRNVFERLIQIASDEHRITLLWEVRCPECIRAVEFLRPGAYPNLFPEHVLGEEYECEICGKDFEVEVEDVYPIFEMVSSYKQRVQTKKKTERQHKFVSNDIENSYANSHGQPTHEVLGVNPIQTIALLKELASALGPNITVNGVMNMSGNINSNNRNMNNANFSNASFNGNANFMGDDVNQTMTTSGISEDVFQKLFAEINKIDDNDDRELATGDAQQLQAAVKTSNWEKAKKIFKRLPETIRLAEVGIGIWKIISAAHGVPL